MIKPTRPAIRPSQKNFFYVVLMLGSGGLFDFVSGIDFRETLKVNANFYPAQTALD